MPTGTPITHVSGSDNPAFTKPLVCTYSSTPRKNTVIDWDAGRRRNDEQPAETAKARCRWCRNKVDADDLRDDMCALCRADAEAKFAPPAPAPIEEAEVEDDAEVEDLVDHIPDDVDEALELSPDQLEDNDAEEQDGSDPEPATQQNDETHPVSHDLPPHALRWAQLLHDTADHHQAAVQTLRSAILTNLAALHMLVDPPEQEQEEAAAAARYEKMLGLDRPIEERRGEAREAAKGAPVQRVKRPRKPRPATNPDADIDVAAVVDRYHNGDTPPTIARDLGCTAKRIRRILDRAGVERRDDRSTHSGSQPKDYPDDLVDKIRRLYLDERLTQTEVADRLGITTKFVHNVMRRHNIPARPPAHKGNNGGGGSTGRSKLSPEQCADICRRYEAGESTGQLADAYQVAVPTIIGRLRQAGVRIRTKSESQRLRMAREAAK